MMKKGMVVEDSMSNLTSASNDASISSGNRDEQSQPAKKRRNLPGNPDPGAEVIALSPRSLLATNRFPCEVCGKGFQRDQNLQLHRRGHNLPWKLKQRNNKEVIRKKVYVCPEVTCVHHDPSRALGDLTGIKKHFCRKHGEKKWKCEKCSKRYAVQSDWKAHSKICGTREYRCDCGTLFSRRDSFITHRAFCDALAEENARPIITSNHPPLSFSQPLKREQDLQEITFQSAGLQPNFFSPRMDEYSIMQQQNSNPNNNPPNPMLISSAAMFSPPPHMSATALLQKASQMGVTMSKPYNTNQSKSSSTMLMRPHQVHMTTTNGLSSNTSLATSVAAAGSTSLDLSSREEMGDGFIHGLLQESFGNKSTSLITSTICMDQVVHEPASFFGGSSSNFNGMLGSNYTNPKFHQTFPAAPKQSGSRGGGNEGLTRDFLGLRAFPNSARDQCDLFMTADLHHMGSSSYEHQNHQS